MPLFSVGLLLEFTSIEPPVSGTLANHTIRGKHKLVNKLVESASTRLAQKVGPGATCLASLGARPWLSYSAPLALFVQSTSSQQSIAQKVSRGVGCVNPKGRPLWLRWAHAHNGRIQHLQGWS